MLTKVLIAVLVAAGLFLIYSLFFARKAGASEVTTNFNPTVTNKWANAGGVKTVSNLDPNVGRYFR